MDENHSCSAIDDQLNMSQLDMEPEMMFPVRVWNAELDGIENYYHQLKTTEDEAYKSFVEQLELEIQQKREDQMATLNAEIHQYMHSVQVNIDQTLKELKELKLRQLKAEHAKKKLELDNAQKRARVNHLEKLGTEFKFRSQLSPSDPSVRFSSLFMTAAQDMLLTEIAWTCVARSSRTERYSRPPQRAATNSL